MANNSPETSKNIPETPASTPEVQNTSKAPEIKIPPDNPELKALEQKLATDKENNPVGPSLKDLFTKIATALGLAELFGLEKEKSKEVTAFFAKLGEIFPDADLTKGVKIQNAEQAQKVREAMRSLVNLDETTIEFKAGDFIIYNKKKGSIDFYPADEKEQSGHSLTANGIVAIEDRPAPEPEEEISPSKIEKGATATSQSLARYIVNRGPTNTGTNSCGRACNLLLQNYGMNNPPRGNGNQWFDMMKNDSRFKLVPINSLSEVPDGGIMTYSGKGTINGKPHGSADQPPRSVEAIRRSFSRSSRASSRMSCRASRPFSTADTVPAAKALPAWTMAC